MVVVLVPIRIFELNHISIQIDIRHFREDMIGHAPQAAWVEPVLLLAATLGNIAQNPFLEAGSNLQDYF